ncbi:AsmA family protein [Roseovarius sp. MMSF_3281]|uniref:AsmA family protein n=1 Tax=Roseovarius sp. MMSF_3281 TaxID=3046694 RepID=UPI00273FBFAA|nr:AsmA family protein [Roseovarius sp. MMSF_3281]
MRWVLRLVGLVVVLAIVAVVSILMLPGDRIARIAADQISSLTGREVSMQGDTTVSFYPVLGISTGQVTVENAPWSEGGPMFTAQSLKIGVEPQALFGGDIRITGLEAVGPKILLERAANGAVNWEIGVEGVAPSGQGETAAAPSNPLALTLDRALITDADLTYVDHGTGERIAMPGMDFDLRWPEYQGTATFDATLRPAGQAVQVSGHLDKVGNFIAGGVSALEVAVTAPGGKVSFAGRAGVQPQVAGRVTADLDSTSRFMAALGLAAPDMPKGLGRAIAAQTDVTLTEDLRLSLRETALTLDNNRLTGAADVMLGGDKPRFNAQLNAGALDLRGLSADDGAAGAAGETGSASGWPKTPIDAGALALADGEIALVADSVDLGDFKIGKTRTLMTLDRARMVFELRELQAYDGMITGQFVMNNRSGLSVGGDMAARGIDLETFLADAIDVSRFSAKADGDLQFLGVGNSLHAIMNSLSGDGAIKTGRGVISGIDLDRLMRSGDGTGGTTVFDSLGASFTMQDGNLRNDDLLMTLPLAKAEGEGRIGLGAQDIDYLVTPVLLEGENRRGLAIPVRIRGPWANPRITPDLEKAIDLNLKEEKEKLEQRVREERKELEAKAEEEVNRALEKELGVTREEGQSVEDAIKNRAEDALKDELLKLFD